MYASAWAETASLVLAPKPSLKMAVFRVSAGEMEKGLQGFFEQ